MIELENGTILEPTYPSTEYPSKQEWNDFLDEYAELEWDDTYVN